MERLRRRGRSGSSSRDSSRSSEVAVAIERKSEEGSVEPNRTRKGYLFGREEGKKEYGTTKSGSNSSSRSTSIIREDDLLTLHYGQRTSGLLTGTVMKKLLEDEMSRDVESRRRPGVIARLMGLDVLPSPERDANKQHKTTSVYNKSLKAGSSASHRCSKNQPHGRMSKEQEQCRDVYEVAGSSKVPGESSSYHMLLSRMKSQDAPFHGKKSSDVKQLSAHERLHETNEFSAAFELLGPDHNLLLKDVDQPNSLFAKHLRYLHDAAEYRSEHDRGLQSGALKHNINAIGCQSGTEASRKIDISFSCKHKEKIQIRSRHKHGDSFQILSNFPSQRKESPCSIPDKIVVLKPNLTKLQSTYSSSHDLLSDFEGCKERRNRRRDIELWRQKLLSDGLELSGIDCRESRQMAREVTRRMKQKLETGSFNASLNGYKGYSADESSYDQSGNEASYESDGPNALPEMSLHRRSCHEASSSRFFETSVNLEAKKRLSERWKMTHRSRGSELVDKVSTLGEMLAIPELDSRPSNTEAVSAHDEACRFSRRNGMVGSMLPLTISSKDGWKDQPIGLLRSRSLPASSKHRTSPKISRRNESLVAERFLIPKDHSRRRSKSMRSSARIRTHNKRSGAVIHQQRGVGYVPEVRSSFDDKRSSFGDEDSPVVKAVISETTRAIDASLIIDEDVDLERGNFPEPLTPPYIQTAELEIPGDMLAQDESCCTDLHEYMTKEPSERGEIEDTGSTQCPAAGSLLQGTIKEADQPSPNSVLEASFEDDLSSDSDCFERVSADLRGLRMQLQLLKQETQAYNEGLIPISSDEDAEGNISSVLSESRQLFDDKNSWASSYFLDVLFHSGFDYINHETLRWTWDSVGCLVAPHVFEKLEKKYSGLAETCSRHERRLLFDRISYGITEILNQVIDPHPWEDCQKRTVGPSWDNDMLKAKLCGLLKMQEMESTHTVVMESDLNWMDLEGEIDIMGTEIERLLINELMGDFS